MELLIVKYPWGIFNILLDEKKQIIEVQSSQVATTDIGTIYVGRVEQVKKNINSAFVRVSDGCKVFVSMQENKPVFYCKRMGKKAALVQGDEVLVQIEKEAHKTKLAKASTAFTLSGRYAVLTTDKSKIFVSSKMEDATRLYFKTKLKSYTTESYGFIIRTNAQYVGIDVVREELDGLKAEFEAITSHLAFKQVYQVIYQPVASYLSMIRDLAADQALKISLCDEAIGREVKDYLKVNDIEGHLNMLKDTSTEMVVNDYSIKDQLSKLMRPKVWLKSGATIVIEATEAMTVIDVNTEKTLSRKASDETILKTNLEAADMIMRQMRSRNMSGIIIVDFIDMTSEDHKNQLLTYLSGLCEKASLKTTVHGMTNLGLVEITRKKLEKPIWENQEIKALLEGTKQ